MGRGQKGYSFKVVLISGVLISVTLFSISWFVYIGPKITGYENKIAEYENRIAEFVNLSSEIGVNILINNITKLKDEIAKMQSDYNELEEKFDNTLNDIEDYKEEIYRLKEQLKEEQLRYVIIQGEVKPPLGGKAKKIRFTSLEDGGEYLKSIIKNKYIIEVKSGMNYEIEIYCIPWYKWGIWKKQESYFYVSGDEPSINLNLKCD